MARLRSASGIPANIRRRSLIIITIAASGLPAASGRSASLELDSSALLSSKAGRLPAVVSVMGQEMPGQHGQFASHSNDGNLSPAPAAYTLVECTQRSWHADGRMGRFHEQGACMRLSLPADVSRMGRARPRLAHARIQAQIADQLGRARETCNVSDHCGDSHRCDQAHTRDGHQVPALPKRSLNECPIRLRCSTAWMRFRRRVCCCTRD